MELGPDRLTRAYQVQRLYSIHTADWIIQYLFLNLSHFPFFFFHTLLLIFQSQMPILDVSIRWLILGEGTNGDAIQDAS